MSRARIIVAIAVVALTVGLVPPASAKFTTHNGADVTQTDVVNGDEFNTCGNRISGLAGYGTSSGNLDTTDQAVIDTVTRTVNYEVFQFPAGSTPSDFQFLEDPNTGVGSYVKFDGNGNVIETAPRVLAFETAPRVIIPGGPLAQPEDFDPTQFLYIYSQVAFDKTISPAAPVGSTLGIKPLSGAALRVLNVVACTTPPTNVVASIDAQPGLSRNPVKISSTSPTLVILVKGSATLDVTKIATAKVGNASPVVSGVFSVLSKPADLTRDGRKDRLYFFRPSQTGLTCSSTSVTIGGTLAGGALWSGTDAIKAIC